MYRRDISSLLIWLGSGVLLMIGFHLLYRPSPRERDRPADSISVEPSISVESDGHITARLPVPPSLPLDYTQTRTLELPTIPPSPYKPALAAVRDDIEAHHLSLAESKLSALPADALSDPKTKGYAAILWNNLGIEQEQIEGTRVSLRAFKRAAALDDSNPVILMNLAHAYWEQRDPALNQELLAKLIKLVPDEPFPHLAMAEWLQERDRTAEAAQHLAQATDRAEQDPALRSYLASVAKKVRRVETAEPHITAQGATQ